MSSHVKKTQKRPQTSLMHQNFPPIHLPYAKRLGGEDPSNFPTYFGCSGGPASYPQNHCWDPTAMCKFKFAMKKKPNFHPHLNWIAFSLSRSHCRRLKTGNILLFWRKLILCKCELNSHGGKLRQLNNWEGIQYSHPKEDQPTADRADWLWNRQMINGGDNILNMITALLRLQVCRYSKAHVAYLKPLSWLCYSSL